MRPLADQLRINAEGCAQVLAALEKSKRESQSTEVCRFCWSKSTVCECGRKNVSA